MFEKAGSGRDAFTFSLGGMTTIASFTIAPAIAHDRLNKIRDQRMSRPQEDRQSTASTASTASTVQAIEDALGRYFAPGCC